MQFKDVWIPYGGYWSTPFTAWQGAFATLPPIPFAAEIAARALSERGIAADRDRWPLPGHDGREQALVLRCAVVRRPGRPRAPGRPDDQPGVRDVGALPGARRAGTRVEGRHDVPRGDGGPHQQRPARVLPEPGGPGRNRRLGEPRARQLRARPVREELDAADRGERRTRGRHRRASAQEEITLLRYRQYEQRAAPTTARSSSATCRGRSRSRTRAARRCSRR